jgi:hypothetical protein
MCYATAQAAKRKAEITAARDWAQTRLCGIYGGRSDIGVLFSEYFYFPCQFSFQKLIHAH